MQTLSIAAQSSNLANTTANLSQKLNKMIASGLQDYSSWKSLILEIETKSPEDISTISLAYDTLLSKFPLCHWHLDKYAYHKAKLCSPQEAVSIYERGLGVGMYSVGFWVDYFTFAAACFGDPEDVRRLFRRAVSFVDKDYYCHALWDKYMTYEFNLEGWSFLAHCYVQALKFPTKKLQFYYDNFKQFVANLKEEIGYENKNCIVEQEPAPYPAKEISADEISPIIKDLLDSPDSSIKSKALDKYRSIGEEFYRRACHINENIKCFETKIQRRYFCTSPLDDDQLDNWHLYLDFIEKQDDMDWAMKLYERCLIPCANYPEFWVRYVEFLNSKGGLELAISALDRAAQIFLKNVPEVHLFNANFKERIGDINGARAALSLCNMETDSSFISSVVTLANLERRLGNFSAATATYEKALKTAKEKRKAHLHPCLYLHFAQLTLLTTGSADAARDILIRGVRDVPHCRFLLEELINFAMTHEGPSHVNVIDPIIGDAISNGVYEYRGLSAKDQEDISNLFLEFVNLCGTAHDIKKAWNRHIRLFPMFLRMKKTPYKNPKSSFSNDLEKEYPKEMSSLEGHDNNATKDLLLSNSDGLQYKENALVPQKSIQGVEKSPETEVAGNIISVHSHEKESRESKGISGVDHARTNTNTDNNNVSVETKHEPQQLRNVRDNRETNREVGPSEGPPAPAAPNQNASYNTNEQSWQAQAQMFYHYQQQHLLQQQYQQMQSAYSQMQYNYYNQQPYQMQPHQQQFGQQPMVPHQQNQHLPHQQNQHLPHQQGQEQHYQSYQMAYQQQQQQQQQQGQQILLQQYQQYQDNQHLPHQQQPKERPQNSIQNVSQNQQGSRKAPPEIDAKAQSSESPHPRAESPQELQ
ncbi:Tetratricopeptide repeat (TPR)-like superfamily protein [Striga hermonthica]|uniref:Tetratricopeptide repeat (TPR)-like superfamily protein n=1 Tax=Striga hermonthica TaxID=68872 RepID=A0A9N7NL24_STRHE|nr:Tetratricopeptide repeat (TPR)-like superfamily protein [Striga hermonthica]